MTTNDMNENGQGLPVTPDSAQTGAASQTKTQPRIYTPAERLLIPVALTVAILFDRLVFASLWRTGLSMPFFSGIFWLSYLVILYAFYWKRLKRNKILWLVGGFSALLCVWNLLFDYDSEFGALTFLVIPAVLMAHAQFLAGDYKPKDVGKLAFAWLAGWFYRPFCAVPRLFGAVNSMISGGKKTTAKKAVTGVLITLPLLLVIVPLLCGADRVFGYYLEQFLGGFEIASFIYHLLVVAIALMLFYSFLWNVGFMKEKEVTVKEISIDPLISCVVLGAVTFVYLLFCTIQFTYLFAGAGLPGGMTYSEYAREGFAQMVVICAINLLIFGVFLRYGSKHKVITVLLAGLLGLTAVMLVSSFVRLRLYISTYGLTWLRFLSAWFIVYLAVVLILCGVRMVKEKLPLIAVCAIVLLGWYTALGYANPDALILRYNLDASENPSVWLVENKYYISGLSDNGILALLESGADQESDEVITSILENRIKRSSGYSLSSAKLRRILYSLS